MPKYNEDWLTIQKALKSIHNFNTSYGVTFTNLSTACSSRHSLILHTYTSTKTLKGDCTCRRTWHVRVHVRNFAFSDTHSVSRSLSTRCLQEFDESVLCALKLCDINLIDTSWLAFNYYL